MTILPGNEVLQSTDRRQTDRHTDNGVYRAARSQLKRDAWMTI